jgi:hypothetical protein
VVWHRNGGEQQQLRGVWMRGRAVFAPRVAMRSCRSGRSITSCGQRMVMLWCAVCTSDRRDCAAMYVCMYVYTWSSGGGVQRAHTQPRRDLPTLPSSSAMTGSPPPSHAPSNASTRHSWLPDRPRTRLCFEDSTVDVVLRAETKVRSHQVSQLDVMAALSNAQPIA